MTVLRHVLVSPRSAPPETSAWQVGEAPAKGEPIVIDAYAAQVAFGIKPARIRQWVKRGQLTPRGRDQRRHLFNAEDIQALLDRT